MTFYLFEKEDCHEWCVVAGKGVVWKKRDAKANVERQGLHSEVMGRSLCQMQRMTRPELNTGLDMLFAAQSLHLELSRMWESIDDQWNYQVVAQEKCVNYRKIHWHDSKVKDLDR